jgi:hypothetical protein
MQAMPLLDWLGRRQPADATTKIADGSTAMFTDVEPFDGRATDPVEGV